jgi:integrase
MGRHREPFTVFKRGNYYYWQTWIGDKRTIAKSTGCTNKGDAKDFVIKELGKGSEYSGSPTLKHWAQERHWWEWERCEYIRGRIARSTPERPAIQRKYAHDAGRMFENHILPHLGAYRLEQLTAAVIDRLMFTLEEGMSRKTVNNVASVLRVMLGEAVRLDLIPVNPFDRVDAFMPAGSERGILTLEEARAVLDPERWKNPVYHAANLVAAATGLRQGEILALRDSDWHESYVQVEHSWSAKFGLGPTKGKRSRFVPIPSKVNEAVHGVVEWPGFLFSLSRGERPVSGQRLTGALYDVIDGFTVENDGLAINRGSRQIVFHSWRAFCNTYFQNAGVPAIQVREVIGHQDAAMTDRYSRFQPGDFTAVAAAQCRLIESVASE